MLVGPKYLSSKPLILNKQPETTNQTNKQTKGTTGIIIINYEALQKDIFTDYSLMIYL